MQRNNDFISHTETQCDCYCLLFCCCVQSLLTLYTKTYSCYCLKNDFLKILNISLRKLRVYNLRNKTKKRYSDYFLLFCYLFLQLYKCRTTKRENFNVIKGKIGGSEQKWGCTSFSDLQHQLSYLQDRKSALFCFNFRSYERGCS